MAYLLGYQIAFYYLGGTALMAESGSPIEPDEKITAWLQSMKDSTELKVSNVTLGVLLSSAYKGGKTEIAKEGFETAFKDTAPATLGDNLLRIDDDIIHEWAKFRYDSADGCEQLSAEIGLDVALCRFYNLTYVGPKTPSIEMILRGNILSPWEQ